MPNALATRSLPAAVGVLPPPEEKTPGAYIVMTAPEESDHPWASSFRQARVQPAVRFERRRSTRTSPWHGLSSISTALRAIKGPSQAATSLTKVDQIIKVDESSIEIQELTVGDSRYRVDPPLRFEVVFNRKDHLYDLEGEFDVNLSAETRPELEDSLDESLEMLWTEYAQEDPSRLAPQAQKLRAKILERFREVHDGP